MFLFSTDDNLRKIIRRIELCELTHELYVHNVSIDEIPNFICIADTQGQFKIRQPLNDDENFGLFAISEEFCGSNAVGGDCQMACSDLSNSDISDDIDCMSTIYDANKLELWNLTANECAPYMAKVMQCIDNNEFQTTKDPLISEITPWNGFFITTEFSVNREKENYENLIRNLVNEETTQPAVTADDLRKILQEIILRPSETLELPLESSSFANENTIDETTHVTKHIDDHSISTESLLITENLSNTVKSVEKKLVIALPNLDLELPKQDDYVDVSSEREILEETTTEYLEQTTSSSSEETSLFVRSSVQETSTIPSIETTNNFISTESILSSTEENSSVSNKNLKDTTLTLSEIKNILDQIIITPDQVLSFAMADTTTLTTDQKDDETTTETLILSEEISSTEVHEDTTTLTDDDLVTEPPKKIFDETSDQNTSKIIATLMSSPETESTTESIFPVEILRNKNLKDQIETVIKVHSDHDSLKGNSSQLVFNIFNFNINGDHHDVKYSISPPNNQNP